NGRRGSRAASSSRRVNSPSVLEHALAGIAGDVAGELAVEGAGDREAAQPFHLGAGADERGVGIGPGAVHDEAGARQGLEQRGDGAVRIVVVRPGGATA